MVNSNKRPHHDLVVWKEAVEFVSDIYSISKRFPKEEVYGLTSQIRRAAVSIPSNIAEGAGRDSQKEFIHFLYIARGSLSEVETQLIIAKKLGYINDDDASSDRLNTIFKLLGGLIKSVKNKEIKR